MQHASRFSPSDFAEDLMAARRLPGPTVLDVLSDIRQIQTVLVNCFLVGERGSDEWVVVDTGIPGFASRIQQEAQERFNGTIPKAIILTHGHFDHVGSVRALADYWNVPVYAHELELPYLTGRSNYPPPDPSVGGGMLARSAKLFPWWGIDLGDRVHRLPDDGQVPGMPGWRWIHTPGHTPGHVSLFRDEDRTLIAGDAFITQKQESLSAVLTNRMQIHGPPAYFTSDWNLSAESVRRLADLSPLAAVTGHGLPMEGEALSSALAWLAEHFEEAAVPPKGRYVREPARADERGVTFVPPPVSDPANKLLLAAGIVGGAALLAAMLGRRR